MQFPKALRHCNISTEQEEMLVDSLMALRKGNLPSVGIHAPHASAAVDSGTSHDMAEIGRAWEDMDYSSVGVHLGRFLRRKLLRSYPQKYTVLSSGKLSRLMARANVSGRISWIVLGSSSLVLIAAIATAYTGWR